MAGSSLTRKLWRAANPDKVKANKAAYQERHREALRLKSAERYARLKQDPEYMARKRARVAAWRKANPHQNTIDANRRRARKAGSDGRLSPDIEERLLKAQKGRCPCCRQPLGADYHLDHILPLALGGTNTDDNVQLLRAVCNRQKHAKHPVDFMQAKGFLL